MLPASGQICRPRLPAGRPKASANGRPNAGRRPAKRRPTAGQTFSRSSGIRRRPANDRPNSFCRPAKLFWGRQGSDAGRPTAGQKHSAGRPITFCRPAKIFCRPAKCRLPADQPSTAGQTAGQPLIRVAKRPVSQQTTQTTLETSKILCPRYGYGPFPEKSATVVRERP